MAMDRLPCTLKHSELTDRIIGVYYDVYNEVGHGFLESTYAEEIVAALEASGLHVDREVPVWFRGKEDRAILRRSPGRANGDGGTESRTNIGKGARGAVASLSSGDGD